MERLKSGSAEAETHRHRHTQTGHGPSQGAAAPAPPLPLPGTQSSRAAFRKKIHKNSGDPYMPWILHVDWSASFQKCLKKIQKATYLPFLHLF